MLQDDGAGREEERREEEVDDRPQRDPLELESGSGADPGGSGGSVSFVVASSVGRTGRRGAVARSERRGEEAVATREDTVSRREWRHRDEETAISISPRPMVGDVPRRAAAMWYLVLRKTRHHSEARRRVNQHAVSMYLDRHVGVAEREDALDLAVALDAGARDREHADRHRARRDAQVEVPPVRFEKER